MRLRLSDLATAVGGRVAGPDVVVDGASIDSRGIEPGQLFVPIVAARDGHDFIDAALDAGAAAYFTSRPPGRGSAVAVDDTLAALGTAGRRARAELHGPVIGVTGSVGKTSVKDMLAAVLRRRLRTAASERSFNNELGVPLTLLNAADPTEAVVVEMGARGVGHIAALCTIAAPTVGIVTRVAAAHTEVFGTLDDVARAKSELVAALPTDGAAVLNAGDDRVRAMADVTRARVVTYGEGGDVRATDVALDASLCGTYRLRSPWGDADVTLAVRGLHQVDNSLAAAAAALACGLSPKDVAVGLAGCQLSPWRMELATAPGGALVLNDAYNANPTSMAAALESLAALRARRHVAVLGVMAVLGASSDADHAAVSEHARRLGIEVLAVAAPAYGADDVPDIDAALERLADLAEGDAVLVKGSRVAGLERLADRLLNKICGD